MTHSIKVTFKPENRTVYVLPGTPVLEAAARAGITVETPCGGQGSCGKCRVEVLQGAAEPTAEEKRLISAEELKKGIRLACQSQISKSITIHIPLESRFSAQKILTAGVEAKKEIHPTVEKFYREFPSPTLQKSKADLEIIRQAFPQGFKADIHIIRQLPQVLKKSNFKVTCVFSDGELISVE
ncbi:2Fe-2S iron-sulfur cluster binding domain-containing protein, partial [bacterium]|nr:2Fe-2S iron-sulfur cluster binding domain-containing protein [bacterium]